jgi:hypothetical protein
MDAREIAATARSATADGMPATEAQHGPGGAGVLDVPDVNKRERLSCTTLIDKLRAWI